MFPIELQNASGGLLDQKPTICGGYDGNDYRNECWQLINNQWKPMFYLKTKRSNHASLVINNQLIISGGYDGNQRLSSTEIISNGRTLDGPELQLPLAAHCMVNYNSVIYIIGGKTNSGATAQTWIHSYDMKFIRDGPKMTSARSSHGCATLNIKNKETIIAVGGDWLSSDSAEFLDPITNSWKESKSFRCNFANQ